GLHHLDEFSVIESWSGYFHPTDPTGTVSLPREPTASAANLVDTLRSEERRWPTFLGFYVGRADARFRDDNVRFNAQLRAAHIPHVFDVYPGAHTTALWQKHAAAWLRLGLRDLAA